MDEYHRRLMPRSPQESFKTHSNYLRAFVRILGPEFRRGDVDACRALLPRIQALGLCNVAQRNQIDRVILRRSLHNAWGTELLISAGEQWFQDEEIIAVSNNWTVVQAYYVLYHATQAYSIAKGQERQESHPATQRCFAAFWADRNVNLAPWTMGACNTGNRNIPNGVVINAQQHVWANCDDGNCWSIACKALKTTWEHEIVEPRYAAKREALKAQKKRKWQDDEDARLARGRRARKKPKFGLPNLTPAQKADVKEASRTATIMDYLYRLRIRANYEDSTMFTEGPDFEGASAEVRQNLAAIAAASLFVHECSICALVGRRTFVEWVDAWINGHQMAGVARGLAARRALFDVAFPPPPPPAPQVAAPNGF